MYGGIVNYDDCLLGGLSDEILKNLYKLLRIDGFCELVVKESVVFRIEACHIDGFPLCTGQFNGLPLLLPGIGDARCEIEMAFIIVEHIQIVSCRK